MAQKSRMTAAQFLSRARAIHGGKYQYPDLGFSNNVDYISIICPIHGEFRQQVSSHINQESGCPKCWRGFSRGEERIEQCLIDRKIIFVRQEIFGGSLKSDKGVPLRFDFYLPSFNLIIEYDGAQHFFPFPYSKEEDEESVNARFQLIQKHDEIKNEYAKARGISMVRLSYLEFKKIDALIDQALCERNL